LGLGKVFARTRYARPVTIVEHGQGAAHEDSGATLGRCSRPTKNRQPRFGRKGITLIRSSERLIKGALAVALIAALFTVAPAFADDYRDDWFNTYTPTTPTPDTPAPEEKDPVSEPVDAETLAFRAELARHQAELDALEAQLDALDRDLAIATEEYNRAAVELEATRQHLETAKLDLAAAEAAYELQKDALADRARDIYRDGDMAALELLLGSKSIGDLVSRARFMFAMGESEAQLLASAKAQRDQIAISEAQLAETEIAAESLEFELEARKIEIQLRIDERTQMLAAAQTDLLELLDKQAFLRQQEEAALLREILAGASKAGIVVEPGSVVETALGYHGIPYVWGGATPRGFDCSGFVMYVFAQHGISLPHYSGSQFQLGVRVPPADLKPGDAVFFGSPIHHVGIYVGAGYFIHAPQTGDFIKLTKLAVMTDYAGARRYEWQPRTAPIAGAVTDPVEAVR